MSDISHESEQLAAARALAGTGFVLFVPPADEQVAEADIMLLRDPGDKLVPGRFIGCILIAASDELELHEVVGIYRIDSAGEPLSTFLEGDTSEATGDATSHDWGAMGFPEGAATLVKSVGSDAARNDVTIAQKSAGYRAYQSKRELSIAPGDIVRIDGNSVRVVALDRRKRIAEVDVHREVREVTFDYIDELENA